MTGPRQALRTSTTLQIVMLLVLVALAVPVALADNRQQTLLNSSQHTTATPNVYRIQLGAQNGTYFAIFMPFLVFTYALRAARPLSL